jgi:hypothetical protein
MIPPSSEGGSSISKTDSSFSKNNHSSFSNNFKMRKRREFERR